MRSDRDDSFPFDFEPNGIPIDLKLKGKLSSRAYPIQCERKWKYSFLSVSSKFGLAIHLALSVDKPLQFHFTSCQNAAMHNVHVM